MSVKLKIVASKLARWHVSTFLACWAHNLADSNISSFKRQYKVNETLGRMLSLTSFLFQEILNRYFLEYVSVAAIEFKI